MTRSLCKLCKKRPVAINYYKGKKAYYRSKCEQCATGRKPSTPSWYQSGYRMQNKCEKCGFESKHSEQFNVFHIDGKLNNTRYSNLKTICANCQRILQKEGVTWKQGDLTPDF
jgi:hypothetical protein